jgi:N-acetylglucosaminyl-diphospho-decaprenol L-rhamnosyltransferase
LILSQKLTLSIVSHGHGALLEKLVEELDNNLQLKDVHLIVTLNRNDELFSFKHKKTRNLRLTIIKNKKPLGFGANHNQAFNICKTSWFAILNPDLSISIDVFTPMIKAAIKEGASLVAPNVIDTHGVKQDSVRANITPWALIMRRLDNARESNLNDGKFHWFAGMFYLVNSSAYNQIGGFNENYFLYCEDYDLCARMHLAGKLMLYMPNITITHDARRASWKSLKYLLMHIKSILKVWFSLTMWRIALSDLKERR